MALRRLVWVWVQNVATVAALIGVVFTGFVAFQAKASEQADAGIAVLKPRVDALEARALTQEHATIDLKSDVHDLQLDVRELYRVIQTGTRSARLEAPPDNDGGK